MSSQAENIRQFCLAKAIAVVGVSDRDFGGIIYRELKDRGFAVYAVHPARTTFADDPCYPSLVGLPEEVKAAVIAVAPHSAELVVKDAIAAGFTHLWFQRGRDFSQAESTARNAGIHTVSDKCILLYAGEITGIHAFHRFLAKMFGRY